MRRGPFRKWRESPSEQLPLLTRSTRFSGWGILLGEIGAIATIGAIIIGMGRMLIRAFG